MKLIAFRLVTPQTLLSRLYVALLLLLLDFTTGTTIYVGGRGVGGGQNEDSFLLLQQVDSRPLTLKEVWLFNVSPIFFHP